MDLRDMLNTPSPTAPTGGTGGTGGAPGGGPGGVPGGVPGGGQDDSTPVVPGWNATHADGISPNDLAIHEKAKYNIATLHPKLESAVTSIVEVYEQRGEDYVWTKHDQKIIYLSVVTIPEAEALDIWVSDLQSNIYIAGRDIGKEVSNMGKIESKYPNYDFGLGAKNIFMERYNDYKQLSKPNYMVGIFKDIENSKKNNSKSL